MLWVATVFELAVGLSFVLIPERVHRSLGFDDESYQRSAFGRAATSIANIRIVGAGFLLMAMITGLTYLQSR